MRPECSTARLILKHSQLLWNVSVQPQPVGRGSLRIRRKRTALYRPRRIFLAVGYHSRMPQKPFLAFACGHLTDERLYAAQIAALQADYECCAFAFRDHD